jgi:hypothetical protein
LLFIIQTTLITPQGQKKKKQKFRELFGNTGLDRVS